MLTDGVGTSVVGEVASTGKRAFAVTVDVGAPSIPCPSPSVVVVQALPKGDRGELAVEVLTEVGVAEIVPWAAVALASRSGRASAATRRWPAGARPPARRPSRRAVPGCPRSRRSRRPTRWSHLIGAADLAVVLHEAATASLADLAVPTDGRLLVVVGPEGGLTDEEVGAFTEAGAVSVRLGAEVLRTSTAGVAAVAALLSQTPRWR